MIDVALKFNGIFVLMIKHHPNALATGIAMWPRVILAAMYSEYTFFNEDIQVFPGVFLQASFVNELHGNT